jgi:hypothetical protein
MDQFTRRLVGIGVHPGPVNGADLCRMFNAAIHGRGAPRHLSTDHDPLFEAHRWTANLRILEIDELKTVPHVPLSHPFVERLIGTMRREFLDQLLFGKTLFRDCPDPQHSKSQQHAQALPDVRHDLDRSLGFEDRPTDLPIQVLHVVGENSPSNSAPWRQKHFERIAFDLTRDRTRDRQPRPRVVCTRRDDQGWTPAALLVSRLRIEGEPDEIPGIGDVPAGYHVP